MASNKSAASNKRAASNKSAASGKDAKKGQKARPQEEKKPAAKAATPQAPKPVAAKVAAPKTETRPEVAASRSTQQAASNPTKTGKAAMPTLFFYQKPAALNREAHRKLKIRGVPSFAYSAKVNSVPLTGNEFASAARQLPIVFVLDAQGNPSPVALLGLRNDENLFVDAEGRWSGGYIPAFIRRYPFVLIEKETPGEYMVGIDEQFPGFNTDEGEALFADDGSEGPALKRAVEFLNAYQTDARRTVEFMGHLKRLELLVPRSITVNLRAGGTFKLDGFSVIDEAKLVQLDAKEAGNLLRTGYMGWIFMHLLSMHSVQDLSSRLDPRLAA